MAMISWSIRFKEAGYTPEQLKLLAVEYHQDLVEEQVTPAQFDEAAKIVRRRCKWFPKFAEIMEAVNEYRSKPRPTSDIAMIADHTSEHDLTPEEIARNKERIELITDMLAGKISAEEAEGRIRALEIKHFGERG